MALTRMRARLTVVRWLLFVFALAITAHADTVVIDEGFEELNLGKHLELAYDPTGEATIDDVLAGKLQFTPSTKDVPNFGYRKGAEWARVELDDRRRDADRLVLRLAYAQTDSFDVYDGAGQPIGRAGDHVPLVEWKVSFREPAVFVYPHAPRLIVRVGGGAVHQLPLSLQTPRWLENHRVSDTGVEAAYFGALVAMAAYNFLVWFAVKDALYLQYVAFLVAYGVFQTGLAGFGFRLLWPGQIGFADRIVPSGIGFVGICSSLFAMRLLETQKVAPRFNKVGRFVVASLTLHQLVAWLGPYNLAMRIVIAVASVWAVFLIGSGVVSSRSSRIGRIFLGAWLAFM